ncbi:cyclin-dependent kinase 4 inhibitor C [Dromaius novaehollandiae]|uniref:Cyclin dependent kinase inhibitor 2C n=3 Tax=Casuariiformes TaxID=8784 RepID=A0A8C4K9Q4_DRONO|nr:cyclin-dependent kinase 4 inhibitor C [Dromaius novaehollandiae]
MAEPSGNELASAAAKGDLVQLTNLLQKNVNVNAQNGFGRTALQVMKLGNPEIARRLLSRGANPNLKDSTGFAVIHDVARAGFLDTLQTLLEFKADVNIEDAEGNLPLHLAAQEGHAAVVEFLLRRTASRVGHQNKRGATACDLARLYKRTAVLRLLEGARPPPAPQP